MSGGGADPTALFELVSDDTRLGVLRALADAHGECPTDPWLEYTELQDAVGVRDNGNFNYHLDRLDGLVVKGEPGYRLSRVGMRVVSAVASGALDPGWTWGPVDAPGECPTCGGSLHLRYEDGVLRVTCGQDDHAIPLSVPPSLLESPPGGVIERVAFLENRWGALTRQGICSECGGHVDGEVVHAGGDPEGYHYDGECQRCGFRHGLPVGLSLVNHPAVVAFYHDHGVDVRTTPFWTLEWCLSGSETVVSSDPLRVRVTATEGDDALSLTLDRGGAVVETERHTATTDDGGE